MHKQNKWRKMNITLYLNRLGAVRSLNEIFPNLILHDTDIDLISVYVSYISPIPTRYITYFTSCHPLWFHRQMLPTILP